MPSGTPGGSLVSSRPWGGRVQVGLTGALGSGCPPDAPVVLELPGIGQTWRNPGALVGVLLTARRISLPAGLDPRFAIYAEITFQTGGAKSHVNVDIPVGGSALAVPAADGLTIRAWAEGTAAGRYWVEAMACTDGIARHSPPTFTQFDTLPMPTRRATPPYAKNVRFFSDSPAGFAPVEVRFSNTGPVGGFPVTQYAGPASAGAWPIAPGATHYRFVDLSGGPGQNVTSVWELCL